MSKENNKNNLNKGNLNEEKKTVGEDGAKSTGRKKELIVIASILAAVLAVWCIVFLTSRQEGGDDGNNSNDVNTVDNVDNSGNNNGVSVQQEETLRPDAKPMFKFFYNSSDEKAAELMAVLEELENTYGDRVIFDISDLDEHPEYVEQFSIMMAPQLYMLEADGNFADIKLGVYDKAELEDAISKVFKD